MSTARMRFVLARAMARATRATSVFGALFQECGLHAVDSFRTYVARVDDGAKDSERRRLRNVVFRTCRHARDQPIGLNTAILGLQGWRQEGTQAAL